MKAVRACLVVVILLNLALLAVSGPLRATLARYDLARRQTELRRLAVENRVLLGSVAQARRPDRVAAKAASMGVSLQMIEHPVAGASPVDRKPVAPAPVAPRR